MRSSSDSTRSTETTKRRSDATGCFPAQQVVAALGQRHVHGVDLVVGHERQGDDTNVALAERVAHPFEVLVDAHAHQLHLEAELIQLGGEGRPNRAVCHPNRPVT